MLGLREQNNRVYRGMRDESPEELEARLGRIRQSIIAKIKELRLVKQNPLLHCLIYQYNYEIRKALEARKKIKGILLDKKA